MSALILNITLILTTNYMQRFDYPKRVHQAKMAGMHVIESPDTVKPLPLKSWTNLYVLDHKPCKVIRDLREFEDKSSESCFLIIDNF